MKIWVKLIKQWSVRENALNLANRPTTKNYHLSDEILPDKSYFFGQSDFTQWNKTVRCAKVVNVLVFPKPFAQWALYNWRANIFRQAKFSHQGKKLVRNMRHLHDESFKLSHKGIFYALSLGIRVYCLSGKFKFFVGKGERHFGILNSFVNFSQSAKLIWTIQPSI